MRYLALACDYDGTIAHHGQVDESTLAALGDLQKSGRKLILVTGRELEDLSRVFPAVSEFDCVVAENGALLYWPKARQEQQLGPEPARAFVEALEQRGLEPLSVGRVIVATWEPHQQTVLDVIHELGLELQVIFNKGAVMVLPAGINKRTGLKQALDGLGLSFHNCVAVGDAENDHAFLSACECSFAVANALESVKETVDFVTASDHGTGVCELVRELIQDDLQSRAADFKRHDILLGSQSDGSEFRLRPYGSTVLVAGVSGGGKSSAAMGLLERLAEQKYQFCLIDPEGDYEGIEIAVRVGNADQPPDLEEVMQILRQPEDNVVVNLLGVRLADRTQFFGALLTRLNELRASSGRPHWLIVDEAHHMLHESVRPSARMVLEELGALLAITVHPDQIYRPLLERVNLLLAVGSEPEKTLRLFADATGSAMPLVETSSDVGQILAWDRHEPRAIPVSIAKGRGERRRHTRKYAEGELGPDKSFYFRGPQGKLNLRAQNLILFNQIAEGVDDETWAFHLRTGDIARWFEEAIKDEELASEARKLEKAAALTAAQSRQAIREAIETRYTLPAR